MISVVQILGRLANVTWGNDSVGYSYVANSTLIANVTSKHNANTTFSTSKSYDNLNRLTAIDNYYREAGQLQFTIQTLTKRPNLIRITRTGRPGRVQSSDKLFGMSLKALLRAPMQIMFGHIKVSIFGLAAFLVGCTTPSHRPAVPLAVVGGVPHDEVAKIDYVSNLYKWRLADASKLVFYDYGFAEAAVSSGQSVIFFPRDWGYDNFEIWFLDGIPKEEGNLFALTTSITSVMGDGSGYRRGVTPNSLDDVLGLGALGIAFGQTAAETRSAIIAYCNVHRLHTPVFTISSEYEFYGFIRDMTKGGKDININVYFLDGRCFAFRLFTDESPMLEQYEGHEGITGFVKEIIKR